MPDREAVTALAAKGLRRTAVHLGSPAYAGYRRRRSAGRPEILVYADSRGTNVTGMLGKSLFRTWVSTLMRTQRVRPVILPRRHTTLLDFLNQYEGEGRRYAAVVLHAGIVDFSPRPAGSIPSIVAEKSADPGYRDLFARHASRYRNPDGPLFRGEPTTTLYSEQYLAQVIAPRLAAVPNLLWVTTNDFVPGWEGNYTRGRPVDIGRRIAAFEAVLRPTLENVVDLHEWSHAEVRQLTVDNVHLSPEGAARLAATVDARLDALTGSPQ